MATAVDLILRQPLLDRRLRLEQAVSAAGDDLKLMAVCRSAVF